MEEDAAVVGEGNFVEVVHVELPHEGGHPVVAEVAPEDVLLEAFLVEDADAPQRRVPGDGLGVLLALSGERGTRRMLASLAMNSAGLSSWSRILSNIIVGEGEVRDAFPPLWLESYRLTKGSIVTLSLIFHGLIPIFMV